VEQNFSEVRWARNMFTKYCNDGCCYKLLDAKYTYFNPDLQGRSFDKTTTGVPNSGVSGHSTFSAAANKVSIIPSEPLRAIQRRPLTRLYGAIHYRSDCEQGA
jgi:hypothetical protein